MTAGLRSGQVAAAAGVNLQTLRYYERRGLLDQPRRTLGGHRLYPTETVTVLRVIKTAQRLGFRLDEITDLLAAGAHSPSPAASRPGSLRGESERGRSPRPDQPERGGALRPRTGRRHRRDVGLQARAESKLAEVERKIADLLVIRDTLRQAVDAGCDDLITCAGSPGCPLPFAELAEGAGATNA